MNSFLNTLELRLGRFAVPGLVAILGVIQLITWVLLRLHPEFGAALFLFRPLVEAGEWWRLVSWVFVPGSMQAIWVLLGALLMLTFSAVMDHAWGAFRTNLYVFGGMLFMILGHWFFDPFIPPSGFILYSSIFLAFCAIVPNYEISLFMILPIKVKYLGMINGGYLILNFIDTPLVRPSIFFGLLNFFLAFGPAFFRWLKQRGNVAQRRARFESAQPPADSFFHKCATCGKTEVDDPKLDFRVTADGEEYCSVCRPKKSPADSA